MILLYNVMCVNVIVYSYAWGSPTWVFDNVFVYAHVIASPVRVVNDVEEQIKKELK